MTRSLHTRLDSLTLTIVDASRLYYQRMDFVSSISFTILHILCWEHFIFLRQIALSFSSAFCCCFQFARYRWKPTRVALEKATRRARTRWDSLYLISCMNIICEGVHVLRVGTNINVVVVIVGSTWGEMWNMHSSKFKLFVCWEFKAFASALCGSPWRRHKGVCSYFVVEIEDNRCAVAY